MENDGVMDYASDDESNDEVDVDFRNEDNKCSNNQIHVVGTMLLDSDMEAYSFYNRYAKTVGFCVRKNSIYRNVVREIMRRDLTCTWEGFYKQKTTPVKKKEIEENFTGSQPCDDPPLRNPIRKNRFGPKARIKDVLETKSKKSKRTARERLAELQKQMGRLDVESPSDNELFAKKDTLIHLPV
ncbi:hypothetical protein IFM89_023051 [Coptis chinensis]|uniref:FAR1 domain-containing protein n=1 Tax=Coptis chinensis TaxID=261450 RepID=A0A835IWN1_9MAGN|nr:hypothetical protein IFM89_023051 [Coptis chinensis]